MCEEIAECIDSLKDGIHAVLVVVSTCRLPKLFGSKVLNYMIVVFTGGEGMTFHLCLIILEVVALVH